MRGLSETGGLILAAGFSSRMGQFKPLMPLSNTTAIGCAVESMRSAGIEKIAVVTGHNRKMLEPELERLNVTQVYNPDYADEMFTSMRAGIKYFDSIGGIKGVFMVPVDCPCVQPNDYSLLYRAVKDVEICACCSFMGRKGHPLWIPSHLFKRVLEYCGGGGMKGALNGVEIKRIDSENEGVLLDMDTQQGYETVLRFINNGYRFPTAIQAAAGKRLILVRHGRIVQHAGKIFLGQYDAPLSELGRMDAVHAAEETARIAPRTNVIYTSPLSRASDTARIIAGKINAGVAVREGLEEISLGSWDGRLIEEVAARFPQAYMQRRENPLTFAPPGGESMIHLRIRILQEIRDICGNDAGGDIVLVTHAGVINTIKCLLGHGDFDNIFDMEKVEYGSVTVLEVDDEDCKA